MDMVSDPSGIIWARKLSNTKLEIDSSVLINRYSMKVRICLLLACSASVEHNSFLLPLGQSVVGGI